MKNDFCIIGLGNFGLQVVKTLVDLNKKILAIDLSEVKIQAVSDIVTTAIVGDATDQEVLENAGVQGFENVILGISKNINASILTTTILKDLGIPNIIAKAESDKHEKILKALGIETIIRPNLDAGKRAALRIAHGFHFDVTELDENYSFARVDVTNGEIIGTPLEELDLRKKRNLNIVAIRRKGTFIIPTGKDVLNLGDIVFFIANNHEAKAFYKKLSVNVLG